jgi:hypothetical protein
VDEGANQHAVISLTKRRTPNVPSEPTEIEKKLAASEAALAKAKADHESAVAKMKADHDAEVAKLKPAPEPTQEELEKAMPANLREAFNKARQQADDFAKKLDAEIEKRESTEWIAKANGYGAVGIDPTVLGGILRKAAKAMSAEDMGKLEGVLKAAGAIADKADLLTKTIRKAGGTDGNSASAKIEKRVGELRKEAPELTYHQAYSKALDEKPELYNELSNEEA